MSQSRLFLDILTLFAARTEAGQPELAPAEIVAALQAPPATVRRYLDKLIAAQKLERYVKTTATRYRLLPSASPSLTLGTTTKAASRATSPAAIALRAALSQPLGTRQPVTYQRQWLDAYQPNISHLLPASLADELYAAGRLQGQQPAGTYARKVLEPLLIDLSWASSYLEGNRYTRLDTEALFRLNEGAAVDHDAVMLLNHKAAIEFLVDSVPTYGLTASMVRNLHAVLMQGLLADEDALGMMREKVVNISDTVYVPTQIPSLLAEMFGEIVDKARQIKNPIEAAFFMWCHLAYLQAFDDGNKRVSRLAANIPLMLYNCAPLSFMEVSREAYTLAMLGIYEQTDCSLAIDLFASTYRRSIRKYATLMESFGLPDPFRIQHRETLNQVIQQVVRERIGLATAILELGLPAEVSQKLSDMARADLTRLAEHNCARYRLTLQQTANWIADGRPM
jgi:Fic family protein